MLMGLRVDLHYIPNGAPITPIGIATPAYCHASSLGPSIIFFQYIPNKELIAIKTTEVGVAVFSVTRKNSVRILKQQMSIPVPDNPVKIPPINPKHAKELN